MKKNIGGDRGEKEAFDGLQRVETGDDRGAPGSGGEGHLTIFQMPLSYTCLIGI